MFNVKRIMRGLLFEFAGVIVGYLNFIPAVILIVFLGLSIAGMWFADCSWFGDHVEDCAGLKFRAATCLTIAFLIFVGISIYSLNLIKSHAPDPFNVKRKMIWSNFITRLIISVAFWSLIIVSSMCTGFFAFFKSMHVSFEDK